MSFPAIFRRLFQKEGAGPLLRKEIIPPHADTHGAQGSDPITPESIGALPATASGGAASADVAVKLKTARAIDGVSFDGSAAVTHYATCSTAAATAAKVVSLAGFTLVTGAKVTVRFAVTNTAANPTLNVNKTGAKAIQYRNAAITAGALAANRTYEFVYDGSSWELVGDLDSNTTYAVFTKATASAAGKAGLVPAPGAGKQEDFLRGDGTWQAVVGLVPVGGIVAFSGTFSGRNPIDMKTKKAMTGWCLCDGTKTNGLAVPDLRDRMIMGAGTTYETGAKGGAATHTHSVSGTVGGTTTTVAQTAAHGHKMRYTDISYQTRDFRGDINDSAQGWDLDGFDGLNTSTVGGSTAHTHSLSGIKSGSASSLPPYYALAYIMRIA